MLDQVKVVQPTEVLVPAARVKHDITETDISVKVTTLQQYVAATCGH